MSKKMESVRILERDLPGNPLGRSLIEHDPRSRKFSLSEYLDATPTPDKRSWRRYDIFDQNIGGPWNGNRPESSCTFQAEAGMLVSSPLRKEPVVKEKLPQLLDPRYRWQGYLLAQDLDQWPGSEITNPTYSGSSGLGAAKAAQLLECVPDGWTYRWSFSGTEEMKQALQHTTLSVGTFWTTGMDNPDPQGRVSSDGTVRGGHQYGIKDWNTRMKCFVAPNSWGRSWGLKGNFLIPESVMIELLDRHGDVHCWLPPADG